MFEMLRDAVLPEEMILGQLPTAMRYGACHYRLSYEPIRGNDALAGVLIVIDDVTEALKRAREEAEQKEQLAISRRLSRDRSSLLGFFEEGRALMDKIREEGASADELRAPIHTLKGSAGMLELEVFVSLCHSAESAIAEGTFGPDTVAGLSERWTALEAALELLLGRDGRNQVDVTRSDLEALVSRMRSGAGAEEAIETLERWQLHPLARPLGHLGERARELCKRLDRGECALRIDDGGLLGDPREGSKLWAALVHLVRNAVDHGFETQEERRALGKPLPATLELCARQDGNSVLIEVTDDGRGIAWETVRERALEQGLPSSSFGDLVEALFAPSLSTRTEVTATSGRGIGLCAVRNEVASFGGSIELESEPGRGARWMVRVPPRALGIRLVTPASGKHVSNPPPRERHQHSA
jgi:two-component system chemotaxis sensor kinase CheA